MHQLRQLRAELTRDSRDAQRRAHRTAHRLRTTAAAALLVLLGLAACYETRASWLQARYFTRQASQLTYEIGAGPSDRIRFPRGGPYDRRLGYTRLPAVLQTATGRSYAIATQARVSERFAAVVDRGLAPIFPEKTQAGLRILDRYGDPIFEARYPERVYRSIDAVPAVVWRTLLFLENRAVLDPRFPNHNPAIAWSRLAQAGADYTWSWLGSGRPVPGASTLATQLEKLRHSPGGRTRSPRDKLQQMEAAALRSYLGGANTEAARRRIVVDYLNSVPLAAIARHGEVTGLGDGLWAWYGADLEEVNRLLLSDAAAARGLAYRQVLSLLLAHRRPSYFLVQAAGRDELRVRTDQHLRLLARAGIIPAALRDAALAVAVTPRNGAPAAPRPSFVARKGANAVRTELLGLTGVGSLYELDRFDLTARTTLDLRAQQDVTTLLERLTDPAVGFLHRGDPARVIYAVAVYERTAEGNVIRVQVDNSDSPFNVIEGSKLELGSTAKLRTLITYLEIVEQLYHRHVGRPAGKLRTEPIGAGDGITAWTLAYLAANPDASFERVLQAAMSRPYSASPGESFTGGGTHMFRNVDSSDDHQIFSVREAFIRSVNLPFIRIMRDITHYYLYRSPGSMHLMLGRRAETPWDGAALRREQYVARLADQDGRASIDRFYRMYASADSGAALDAIARGRPMIQLAWAYRSVAPQAGLAEFGDFVRRHVAASAPRPSAARVTELYDGSDPTGLSISDRGRVAGMDPLDLWVAGYLSRHPGAPQQQVLDASAAVRQEIYGGRFPPERRAAPDRRVGAIPEAHAFREIHRSWRRLGYPFESLVPSYATAIGSSADRPDDLAELVGILLNDGVRYPVRRVEELHFAAGTPYETRLRLAPRSGERVLSPEIAAVVRGAMIAVVVRGTGRHAGGAVRARDGSPVLIGAKTGTGDNRFRVVGRNGGILEDRAIDRTAAVVFFIGDRFYGSITALVSGARADRYDFTSRLPLQILNMLGPTLEALSGDTSAAVRRLARPNSPRCAIPAERAPHYTSC